MKKNKKIKIFYGLKIANRKSQIATLTFLCIFALPLFSQQKISKKATESYKKAEQAFYLTDYDKAETLCRQALKQNADFVKVYLLLADVYIQKEDKSNAAATLQQLMARNIPVAPYVYLLGAKLEQESGQYGRMKPYLERYEAHPDSEDYDGQAFDLLKKSHEYAIRALQNPVDFILENLGAAINTDNDEYLPCLTADGKTMIFTRRLPDETAYMSNYEQEDFFISFWEDEQWTEAMPIGAPINTRYNEGAGTISANGRILIFTACAGVGKEYGAGRSGYGSCDLFAAVKDGDKWSVPQNLGQPINTAQWESMPSLSADGRSLYFIRGDRTKPNSGDIYVSHLHDNRWGTPQKLPNNVNSQGREHSVFIHPNGHTLYFSSNGHPGMGGFDIFVTEKINDSLWSDPVNLGYPINTHGDENSIMVSGDGIYAYFAANHEDGYGKMDIYRFELPQQLRPEPITTFPQTITSEEKDPFPEKIETGVSFIMHNIFFDFDKSDLQPESQTELAKLIDFLWRNPTVAIEIEGHTDDQGDDLHNVKLSESRAESVMNYLITNGIDQKRLSSKGYGSAKPIQSNDTEDGRAANRRTECRIVEP